MKKITFLLILLSICTKHYSQTTQEHCACCTTEHYQFDFWIGDWNVYNNDGQKVGENLIAKDLDGCLLTENWSGASGETGYSYNFYETSDSTWNQIYIDNKGTVLKLKGRIENGKMVLKSDLVMGTDNYYNQITWTQTGPQKVLQTWEIFDENHHLLRVAFEGLYVRKTVNQEPEQLMESFTIATIEYVKILSDYKDETMYYYENNWIAFRKKALELDYIKSFQFLKLDPTINPEFDIVLITEYSSQRDYEKVEERYQQIIKEISPDGPKFLNELRPDEFRSRISSQQVRFANQ